MDVVCVGPLGVASVVWQPRSGAHSLAIACKAAFDLTPGESPLSARQELPSEEEQHWDDDPARSVYAPADLVPFKAFADVVLVGSAYAAHGEPVRSLAARLIVGSIDKTLEVHCDRSFSPDEKLVEGPRFGKMSLFWERAAGGAGSTNPVGVSFDAAPDAYGRRRIPNLQPPDIHVADPSHTFPPVGFGPIAATWPGRRQHLGPRSAGLDAARWSQKPLPPDIGPRFFQCAPPDQQLEELHDNEQIVLENLHVEHTRLVTRLPGIRPTVMVERLGQRPVPLTLRAETLWIDTDARRITLTWRGEIPLAAANEPGQVVVGMEGPGAPRAYPDPPPVSPEAEAGMTLFLDNPTSIKDTLPFAMAPDREVRSPNPAAQDGLPFWNGAAPPQPAAALPAASAAVSPWGGGDSLQSFSLSSSGPSPAQPGVLDASNHAASRDALWQRPPEEARANPVAATPQRRAPVEAVKLLWFDPDIVKKLRRHDAFRLLLAEAELRRVEEGYDEDDTPAESRESGDVFEVLARGAPADALGLREALSDAVSDLGRFESPLVMSAGVLELPFDGLEQLSAAVAAAKPFAATEKKETAAALDVAERVLQIPGANGSSGIIERSLQQLRDAFGRETRSLPADYLDVQTERSLLERRAYQKRTLFGKDWIRALFRPGGGSDFAVAYLPIALERELPLYKSFRVRVLGELEMKEDQYETANTALRVSALGRVL